MAFEPGACRLRVGGGHNGHNGIRSVISALGNQAGFARLRIGVGHPGNTDEMVAYLTGVRMPSEERIASSRPPTSTTTHCAAFSMATSTPP